MPNYVTDRELQAHLDPMKEDIHEIKMDVKALVTAQYHNSWLGGKGRKIVVLLGPVFLAGLISLLIALFVQ